jgi:hypothetical protein
MSVFSKEFQDRSDQFCIIECFLSWLSAGNSPRGEDVEQILPRAINSLSTGHQSYSLSKYCDYLWSIKEVYTFVPFFAMQNESRVLDVHLHDVEFDAREISLKFYGGIRMNNERNRHDYRWNSSLKKKFTVILRRDEIPQVRCDGHLDGYFSLYVYAMETNHETKTRVPLYCEPEKAYEMILGYSESEEGVLVRWSAAEDDIRGFYYGYRDYDRFSIENMNNIKFDILAVGE